MAPDHTVWISDVQGDTAKGLTRASNGPHSGIGFSIQPILPIPSIARPVILFFLNNSLAVLEYFVGSAFMAKTQVNKAINKVLLTIIAKI